ncbi:MAG: hypothetical protein NVS9B4_24900 [Candidatus Acidiferrum sp.]
MNTATRRGLQPLVPAPVQAVKTADPTSGQPRLTHKPRVLIAAESRLLHDVLARMIEKRGIMKTVEMDAAKPFCPRTLAQQAVDILLLTSRGSMRQDIVLIPDVRVNAPAVQTLIIGVDGDEKEFWQYVRAGVRGYLLREASAEDVLAAMQAVQVGEVVCPGALCGLLFDYFEREATSLPSATVQHRLGLTRREQQLIPLIAQGLTNKEIAGHFYLSEQTVKNHLYRMKHKVGAQSRLGIVQSCHSQGFLL